MEIEFRDVHRDLLSVMRVEGSDTLTPSEAALAKEFDKELMVTKGVVFAQRQSTSSRYKVVSGIEVVRAVKESSIEYIPCLITDEFPALLVELANGIISTQVASSEKQNPEDAIQKALETYNQIVQKKLSFRKAETVAKLGKKSTLYVEKRLSKNLNEKVQRMVRDGLLSKSAARSISYIDFDKQFDFAQKAVENEWSVRDIDLARSHTNDVPVDTKYSSDVALLTRELEEVWRFPVHIEQRTTKTGTVSFTYYSLEDLGSLLEKLSKVRVSFEYIIKGKIPVRLSGGKAKVASMLQLKYHNLELLEHLKI